MAAALARVPIFQDRFWCGLWLLLTVIIPGVVGVLSPLLIWTGILAPLALVVLFLHFIASSRVDCRRSNGLIALLLLGGWILMFVSLFGSIFCTYVLFGDSVGEVLFLPG